MPLGSWIRNYAGGYVALWTRELRNRFIFQKYGSTGANLYQRLVPGAYRADLFRYVALYHFGGIYSDIDTTLHMFLPSMQHLFRNITLAVDVSEDPLATPCRLLNGAILMATPHNCLFRCALGEVFDHSDRRKTFKSDLDVSGPGVLAECLGHVVGRDELTFDEKNVDELDAMGFRLFKSELAADNRQHLVKLSNDSVMLSMRSGGEDYDRQVKAECDPGEHYSTIFRKKGVYRNPT